MNCTRKQYCINQYNFKDIKEDKEGKLKFNSSAKKSYSISESIPFKKLYEITDKTYVTEIPNPDNPSEMIKAKPEQNPLNDMFILKSCNIKEEKDQVRYEKLIRDGCYIDNIHFVYDQKSSSMVRTQKTIFTKECIKDKLEEHLTLGKKPNKCVTSKWTTTKGYLLSSSDIIELLPRICVIQDFKWAITSDVYIIEDYALKPDDEKAAEQYKAEKSEWKKENEEYRKVLKEAKKLFTKDYLLKKFNNTVTKNKNNIKSKSQWRESGRRVMQEEILNPHSFGIYNNYLYYPTYQKSQTEEYEDKVFPVKPYIVLKEKVFHKDYPCEINRFDGEGIGSFDFFHKVQEKLGLKHEINSMQIRLPYVKSNIVRVDWKNWMLEHGITKIADMFGKTYNTLDIDIIMTESCFKAKLEKEENAPNDGWLFKDMEEYYTLLEKYNYNYFAICNYSKPHFKGEYTTMTYQFINSMELTEKDLVFLSKEIRHMIKRVIAGDIPSILAFLNIIANKTPVAENNDEEDNEEFKEDDFRDRAKVMIKAIELNQRVAYDHEVQRFIYQRIKNIYQDMQIGRILVPSTFMVATGDVIAMMEWAAYRKENEVKGFLKADEFFCEGINKEMVMTRYPLCHFSEIEVANFISKGDRCISDYNYIRHLNNIIQFNTYDLTMCRLNEDFDGDKNYLIDATMPISNGRVLKDAIEYDYPIYNPDDKSTTDASEFNADAIVKYELLNLQNETGIVTNYNTTYQAKAHMEGSLWKRDYESSICKYYQGQIIDSVKKGIPVVIENEIRSNAPRKPYFMKFIYGITDKNKDNYMNPICTLDYFADAVQEHLIDKLDRSLRKNTEEFEVPPDKESYFDISHIHELMIDKHKYDSGIEIDLLEKLRPIFNDYSNKKGEIWKDSKGINRHDHSDDNKELLAGIKERYRKLYDDTNEACLKICSNKSVLASICTLIEYEYAKTSNDNGFSRNRAYTFPWIVCPEGVLENIKTNEDINKIEISEIKNKFLPLADAINTMGTLEQYGKIYAIKEVVKESKLKIQQSECMKSETAELKEIKDYSCRLIFCNGFDVAPKIDGQVLELRLNAGKYMALFLNGEYIASVAKESLTNLDKGIKMDDYIGQKFEIKVDKISEKSLSVILNQVFSRAA